MGGRGHGGAILTIVAHQSCVVYIHCTTFLLRAHSYGRVCWYLCLPQLTYVDFRFYEILDKHRVFEPALLEGYRVLKVGLFLVLLVCSCGLEFVTFHVGISGPL